jgi:hypothetical protein
VILGLPQRTLSRWTQGGAPPEGVALLRLIERFPWLLEVAEAHFDAHVARHVLVRAVLRPYPVRTGAWIGPMQQAAWASDLAWRPVTRTIRCPAS